MRYFDLTVSYTMRIRADNLEDAEVKIENQFPDIGPLEAIEGVTVEAAELKMSSSSRSTRHARQD